MIAPDDWIPADELTLEPNALRAARERCANQALTAGPGAGKTEMLAQRADFLLRTGECRYPKRILAISFKVDASTNLKDRVKRRCGIVLGRRFDSHTFHAFAKRIIDRFRPVLAGADALDPGYQIGNSRVAHSQIEFKDLIPLATKILRQSKSARNAIRQTYTDVFLDEFQDCTGDQYELIKVAFKGTGIRMIAVGDVKQKIMGWAGALEGIFQLYAHDFAAVPLNMYRNFRSQPRLLRLQNDIIRILDPASVMPSEQLAGEGGEVFCWRFADSRHEADHLARLIASWTEDGKLPYSEVAVLVSKLPDQYAYDLMDALTRFGIPYRNETQLQDLSSEPVARLIVDFLSCLYGQREPKAWMRLSEQLVPYDDDVMQSSTRRAFHRFVKKQRNEIAVARLLGNPYDGWWDQATAFLNIVGLQTLVALSPDYEAHARLTEIIDLIKKKIEELLQLEPELPLALNRFGDDQAVRLLTIHKSKGLEFDSVIMLGIEREAFFGKAADERCVFFVGVSRAKRRLVLTYADQRSKPPNYEKRWDVIRNPQDEFLGYAIPFLDTE
jgi:superfamily I DNA/RNA helicase